MSRHLSAGNMKSRPSVLQPTKSFTRFEPVPTSPSTKRSRAGTAISTKVVDREQHDGVAEASQKTELKTGVDVFEKTVEEEAGLVSPALSRSQTLPENFDDLPVEVASLVDRYVRRVTLCQHG